MKIVHAIESLDFATGGPATAVLGLAEAQLALGHSICIWIADAADAKRKTIFDTFPEELRLELSLADRGADLPWAPDIIHLHGVWCRHIRRVSDAAKARQLPTVQSFHGALGKWSMSQKAWKKRIALALVYRKLINRNRFVHVTNIQEEADAQALGFHCPVKLFPLGLSATCVERRVGMEFPERYWGESHPPYVLFLGRLSFVKAPELLVQAFARIADDIPGVHLVLAGPDYGSRATISAEIEILRKEVQDRIHLPGPIYEDAKLSAFDNALITCVPSRHESFGLVLVEALARGCPVVYSDRCYFPAIAEARAGIECSVEIDSLAQALLRAVKDADWRARASKRGRDLVEASYTWTAIARQMTQAYEHR